MSLTYLSPEELAEQHRYSTKRAGIRALHEAEDRQQQQQVAQRRLNSRVQRNNLAITECMRQLRGLKMQAAHYLDVLNNTTATIANLETKIRSLSLESQDLKRDLHGDLPYSQLKDYYTPYIISGNNMQNDSITHKNMNYGSDILVPYNSMSQSKHPPLWKEAYSSRQPVHMSYEDSFYDSPSEEEEARKYALSRKQSRRPKTVACSSRQKRKCTPPDKLNANTKFHDPVAFDELDYLRKQSPTLPSMDGSSYFPVVQLEEKCASTSTSLYPSQESANENPNKDLSVSNSRRLRKNILAVIDKYLDGCSYSLISLFPPLDRLYQLFIDARSALPAIKPSTMIGVTLFKVAQFVRELLYSAAFYRFVTTLEPIDLPCLPTSLEEAKSILQDCISSSNCDKSIYNIINLMTSLHMYIRAHWFDSVQSNYGTFLHRYYLKFLQINSMYRVTVPLWPQYKRVRLFNAEKHLLRDGELDFTFLYAILSTFAILHGLHVVPVERVTYGYNDLKIHKPTMDHDTISRLSDGATRYTCIWPAWVDKYNNTYMGSRFHKHKLM